MRKLTGNTDIEDSLDRLDKLTQEEARMASAEMLKMTHSIDDRVMGVDDRVKDGIQDVRGDVEYVGNKVQGVHDGVQGIGSDVKDISSEVRGVDDKLNQANRSWNSLPCLHRSERPDIFTGNHLKDNLLRWLLPPDPSINHNIASKARHNGTAQWFFQGSMFDEWKSSDSFLWIHGKRLLLFAFIIQRPLIISCFYSRFGEKCPLVRPSTRSALLKLTLLIQFRDHTRYHGFGRHREGIDSLLLF